MRPLVPIHLILTILGSAIDITKEYLALAADNAASPSARQAQALPPQPTSPLVTLSDFGFSLEQSWAGPAKGDGSALAPDSSTHSQHMDDVAQPIPEYADPQLDPVSVPSSVVTDPLTHANDTFISFEEWKQLKLTEEEMALGDLVPIGRQLRSDGAQQVLPTLPIPISTDGENMTSENTDSDTTSLGRSQPVYKDGSKYPSFSPIAVHQKYNYASPDCSARIHSSSPQTQHASSLLHKSRDRYMLTPCKANQHWVVVELCDEIRVEALEVAVWEFFSGVVREIRVSVGEEDEPMTRWEEIETFVGRNVRGAQVSLQKRKRGRY